MPAKCGNSPRAKVEMVRSLMDGAASSPYSMQRSTSSFHPFEPNSAHDISPMHPGGRRGQKSLDAHAPAARARHRRNPDVAPASRDIPPDVPDADDANSASRERRPVFAGWRRMKFTLRAWLVRVMMRPGTNPCPGAS